MDERVGRTKGFGFVTFETEAEAQNAIKGLDGKVFYLPYINSLLHALGSFLLLFLTIFLFIWLMIICFLSV